MRFVDTNVLLYAVSPLTEDAHKRALARELLKEPDLVVSVQVLQEFYYQATRAGRNPPISDAQALGLIQSISSFPVQDITLDLFHIAVSISRRFGLSYWDGAILAAARAAGCEAVYSEDLSDNQDYDGLQVINPFAEASS